MLTIKNSSAAGADSSGKPAESVAGRIKPVPGAPCIPGVAPAASASDAGSAARSAFKFPEPKAKSRPAPANPQVGLALVECTKLVLSN